MVVKPSTHKIVSVVNSELCKTAVPQYQYGLSTQDDQDESLLERSPHFRVQASMEVGPEDASLLERCPHFRGC